MDDVEQEDLFINPFFSALRKRHPSLYAEAEQNCYLICVPQAPSIVGMDLTQQFIEMHIMRPSPYFQGMYYSFNDSDKEIEIEGDKVLTRNGFQATNRSIRILFEELFYNKQYNSFRVLCLEMPLEGGKQVVNEVSQMAQVKTLQECNSFLKSSPENVIVLRKLENTMLADFKSNFVIAKGFELDAASSVKEIVEHTTEQLLCANIDFRKMLNNPTHLRQLEAIIETWVLGCLDDKLFTSISSMFSSEDELIRRITFSSQDLNLEDIGLRSSLSRICDFSPAIALIEGTTLDELPSPIEKLHRLKEVIDAVNHSVLYGQQRRQLEVQPLSSITNNDENILYQTTSSISLSKQSNESDVITTDDLLPIIVYILIQGKPCHLFTNLFLMQHFVFVNISTTELGFNLVTFSAASEYIRSDKFPTRNKAAKPSTLMWTHRSSNHSRAKTTSGIARSLARKSLPVGGGSNEAYIRNAHQSPSDDDDEVMASSLSSRSSDIAGDRSLQRSVSYYSSLVPKQISIAKKGRSFGVSINQPSQTIATSNERSYNQDSIKDHTNSNDRNGMQQTVGSGNQNTWNHHQSYFTQRTQIGRAHV